MDDKAAAPDDLTGAAALPVALRRAFSQDAVLLQATSCNLKPVVCSLRVHAKFPEAFS